MSYFFFFSSPGISAAKTALKLPLNLHTLSSIHLVRFLVVLQRKLDGEEAFQQRFLTTIVRFLHFSDHHVLYCLSFLFFNLSGKNLFLTVPFSFYKFIHSFIHSFIHLFIHSFTHPSIHSFISTCLLSTHLLIYIYIYWHIYPSIFLSIIYLPVMYLPACVSSTYPSTRVSSHCSICLRAFDPSLLSLLSYQRESKHLPLLFNILCDSVQ